ncbi:hypothetical protein FRB99_008440 [Tulasnella sp. 403]|nr:hypothetical protein FRB99_008440 [Tulasnella sp. 403]
MSILTLVFPLVLFTAAIVSYHFIFRLSAIDELVYGYPDVPEYDEYFEWEDRLPQHNSSLPFPEGLSGRYVKFSNQVWGYGLNNQLQEILLLSHISYLANRAYVFQPYTWDAKADSNAVLDGRSWRSSRIPLNVFISGPTAGGRFATGDKAPRAVNDRWWEKVCPQDKRTILDVGVEHAKWQVTSETEGRVILDQWARRLRVLNDPCVEITGPVIFDFELIASPRILSIWPSLSVSPIITRFSWSTLVSNAANRNLPLFLNKPAPSFPDEEPLLPDAPRHPPVSSPATLPDSEPDTPLPYMPDSHATFGRGRRPPSPSLSSLTLQASHNTFTSNSTLSPVIKGLVAIHLRRGDFKIHCHWLADRTEPFAGWNQFQYLLDRFTPPPAAFSLLGRGRIHDMYMERCWPEIEQIIRKLRDVRRLHPELERVFILTNGKRDWVDKLKRALIQGELVEEEPEASTDLPQRPSGPELPPVVPGAIRVQPRPPPMNGKAGWKAVYTSKDLRLLWTEREVDQVVDMEIARRAQVFVGNGFSSMTSTLVMLRLSDGSPIENIRFW